MAKAYGPLSTFYFFFFAVVGAMLPFWPLYLESLGLEPVQIGTLVALVMVTKIVAPNVWGWMADRRAERMPLVRVACFGAACVFAAVLVSPHFWPLAALMVLFSFFWNSALPLFEAVTLNHLDGRMERYTRIRLWGSVGFVVSVIGLGVVVERDGAGTVPLAILALIGCAALASLAVREAGAPRAARVPGSLWTVLRNPPVAALLLACFLMQAGHGPYYAFYSIYLEAHAYSTTAIGVLWALGVAAEVAVFALMHRLVERAGLRALFLLAFVLTAFRWVLVALLVASGPAMVLAQLLHAASFGLYHAVAIQLVHRRFVAGHQGRGQALYASASFGAGGAAGALMAGFAWSALGATATWLAAAAVTAAAALVVWRYVEVPAAAARLSPDARVPLQ